MPTDIKQTTGQCNACKGDLYYDGLNWRHVANDKGLRECPICPAEYDQYGSKRCTLPQGHSGRHFASWQQHMEFDHDYRDTADID